MKKQYSKPSIFIEDFAINQYIAGSCSGDGMTQVKHAMYSCYITIKDDTADSGYSKIFNQYPCDMSLEDDQNNGICYHIPMSLTNYFSS